MARWLRGPKPDFLALAVLGGLTVVVGLVTIVGAMVRILPNQDVPVAVDLEDVPHELLLGGGVEAEATEAVLRVSDLGPVQYFAVLGAEVLPVVTLLVVAVCFTLLGTAFYRGDFFSRGCVVALNTAAGTLVVAALAVPSLEGTAQSGALASVDVGSGQSMTLGVDLTMLLAGLLLGAVGYAFQRGARLQQDTEGLV